MPFSQEDQERFQAHVRGKLKACPMCGTNNWTISADSLALPTWSPSTVGKGGNTDMGRVMPIAAITCDNCGLLMMYPWGRAVRSLNE